MPAITIVIPSYNHARFLPACLESIRRQTFEDWQIVLIDDGSKDDSVELAREYAGKDSRISVYINDRNLGTYGTQQRGLDLSESPYVAIMNSDDLWSPTKLERQMEALTAHPESPFCYVLGWMVDDEGRELEGEDVHFDWPREEVQDVFPYLLYENRILASGVLFRREGLRFETSCRYSGDWVALLERSFVGPVCCVPERLTWWRQHDSNTYVASPKQMAEEIRVRRAIERRSAQWFLPRLDASLVKRGLAQNAMNLCALLMYFYDPTQARKAGFSALRYGGLRKQSLRRTLGTFLPIEGARRYLWPQANDHMKPDELRQLLSGPELNLEL